MCVYLYKCVVANSFKRRHSYIWCDLWAFGKKNLDVNFVSKFLIEFFYGNFLNGEKIYVYGQGSPCGLCFLVHKYIYKHAKYIYIYTTPFSIHYNNHINNNSNNNNNKLLFEEQIPTDQEIPFYWKTSVTSAPSAEKHLRNMFIDSSFQPFTRAAFPPSVKMW